MPDQEPQGITKDNTVIGDNQVIVSQEVTKEGKTTFPNFRGKTPVSIKKMVATIQKACLLLMGIVGASDIFTGDQVKRTVFILACIAALAEAVQYGFGVDTSNNN